MMTCKECGDGVRPLKDCKPNGLKEGRDFCRLGCWLANHDRDAGPRFSPWPKPPQYRSMTSCGFEMWQPEPRVERFLLTYPSGTVVDAN